METERMFPFWYRLKVLSVNFYAGVCVWTSESVLHFTQDVVRVQLLAIASPQLHCDA